MGSMRIARVSNGMISWKASMSLEMSRPEIEGAGADVRQF